MSSSTSRAWMVAVSVGVVEALKDQAGMCRWNYTLRSIHQHAKSHLRSYSNQQANNRVLVSSSSPAVSVIPEKVIKSNNNGEEKLKQSEESLRKVMYLSCWGPN